MRTQQSRLLKRLPLFAAMLLLVPITLGFFYTVVILTGQRPGSSRWLNIARVAIVIWLL